MKIRFTALLAAVLLGSCAFAGVALAQLAVSSNDGKQLRPGDNPPGIVPDTVSVIDLNHYPPRLLGETGATNSLTGAPTGVAVAPDQSFALVSGGVKVDPADATKTAIDDTLSVIDISTPTAPKVIQTLSGLSGAHGITINKAGTLALVANHSQVSVFTIANKHLTPAGQVATPGCTPSDVVFRGDGSTGAIAVCGTNIVALSVTGSSVALTGAPIAAGLGGYGAVVTPDGRYSVNADLGGVLDPSAPSPSGRGGGISQHGAISVVDLDKGLLTDTAVVGPTPESVSRSPDGKFIAVTVANNSAIPVTDPKYPTTLGILKLFALSGGKLTPVTQVQTGHWCQGSVWNRAGTVVMLQCSAERELEVFRFDGHALTRDAAATITLSARPGGIATAGGH